MTQALSPLTPVSSYRIECCVARPLHAHAPPRLAASPSPSHDSYRGLSMNARSIAIAILALLLVAAPVVSRPAARPDAGSQRGTQLGDTVPTEQGSVRGQVLTDTVVFRGIPYAAPPVGPLRWRAPQTAPSHADVLDATSFGSSCAQLVATGQVIGSEDCLTLNVWAPRATGANPYPVMVFIHGGGNFMGSSSDPLYDGRSLSEAGPVVVVTINYRLGPFGFLAHPLLSAEDTEHHSSGN